MIEQTIDYLYRDGMCYDSLFGRAIGGVDLAFWLRQANRYGGPILELGCGTGRLAIPLAREGFAVTGIDRSEAMLDQARTKSAQDGVSVAWVNADMRDFDLGQPFTLVIIPNNTLCHILHLDDFEAFLSCVGRHLAPDGRFIIDVFVPKMELCINQPGKRLPFAEYDDPYGRGRVVVQESYVYESDTQIKRITTHYRIPGEDAEIEASLVLRMYFPQELDALLRYNGFVLDAKYGTYEQEAFSSESEKQLIICALAS